MVICYVSLRRSWHYIFVPPMEMMHVRSGSWKSNWFLQELTYLDAVLARHTIHAQPVNTRFTKMSMLEATSYHSANSLVGYSW